MKIELPQHIAEMPQIPRAMYSAIYNRRFNDTNWFGTSIGMPGLGKSTSLIKMMYELQVDPKTLERNFDPREQVVFSIKDFIRRVQATDGDKDPGRCILFDEIEIEANSRGWDSISKQLELTVSTMRFKKNIIGASLPHERQLLKSVRRLRNVRVFCKSVNHDQGYVYAKYHNLVYDMTADTQNSNSKDAKNYFPRLNLNTPNGVRPFKVVGVKIRKPPNKIIRPYKKMKVEFLNDFYARQIAHWDREDKKNEDDDVDFNTAFEYIDKYKLDLMYKDKVEPTLLSEALKISTSKAREYARAYTAKKEIKKIKRASYMD